MLTISDISVQMSSQAMRAVNISLTLRKWLIGCDIEGYERNGIDRARYGESLMDELSAKLQEHGLNRCDRRELCRNRQFYLCYPQIVQAVSPQFLESLPRKSEIMQSLNALSQESFLPRPLPTEYL